MPVKEPSTRRDYGFDYSLELGADTITSSTWSGDGLTFTGATFNATTTSVYIEGGTEGQTLNAVNRITTQAGRTYERTLTLLIRAAANPDDDYLLTASDLVRRMAPPPTDTALLSDYNARAARAERMVTNYLKDTSGYKRSTSAGVDGLSISESYGDLSGVEGIVAGAMGAYYLAPNRRDARTGPVPIVAPPRPAKQLYYVDPFNRF